MLINPQLLDPKQIGYEAHQLETSLRSKVIGQDEAIRQVVDIYQAFSLGMSSAARPVGTFLFLGPTGTGKTRLVEATAETLAGDVRAVVKIDCGEFQHSHEIAKLVGSPPGYLGHRDTHPALSQEVLDRFHTESAKLSFVLFDEIEKASDALWNLLLGILDKARLTLGDNRRVDFSRAMIFMTGNVGAVEMSEELRQRFGFSYSAPPQRRTQSVATAAARRRFSPEFLNRIDKIVVFQALADAQLHGILDIELSEVTRRFAHRLRFAMSVTEPAKAFLVQEGTDIQYGARHLKRVVERSILHPLCNLIATEQVRPRDQIRIDLDTEHRHLAFFRDAENLEMEDEVSITHRETDHIAAATPVSVTVNPDPAIALWFCC